MTLYRIPDLDWEREATGHWTAMFGDDKYEVFRISKRLWEVSLNGYRLSDAQSALLGKAIANESNRRRVASRLIPASKERFTERNSP